MRKLLAAILCASVPCLAEIRDHSQCDGGEQHLCENLTQAHIEYHISTRTGITRHCGNLAKACAVLRLSSQGNHCDIYIRSHATHQDRIHERNHCHGWDHRGTDYDAPWVVMNEVADNTHLLADSQIGRTKTRTGVDTD